MAHVTETNPLGALDLIATSLTLDNSLRNLTSLENIDSQQPVVSTLHRAIENLLDDVIHNVMQEVIPGEAEEEALEKRKVRMTTGGGSG